MKKIGPTGWVGIKKFVCEDLQLITSVQMTLMYLVDLLVTRRVTLLV